MLPPFWTKIAAAFNETVAHAFCLHGDGIHDYANGEEVDVIPWLDQALVKAGFDFVLHYDLAQGITFAGPGMKKLLGEVLGLTDGAASATPQPKLAPQLQAFAPQKPPPNGAEVTLPRDAVPAFPLLGQALELAQRVKPQEQWADPDQPAYYKVALIFPYANDLFPASAIAGATSPVDRMLLEFALNWARNPLWRGSKTTPLIFVVSPSLTGINPALAAAVYPVEVAAPDVDVRLAFIERALAANDVTLVDDMTPARLAALTAGMLKVHIMDVIVQARINGEALTADRANARKKEVMQAAYAGVLETEEATGSLDDIAGLDFLVGYLRDEVVQPMKDGDTGSVPMGVLMAGPPGTGKSYLATKLAAEAGVNFVNFRMANILGGFVGQSEQNLEKALAGIRSLTPCIVFVDEIDQAFRRSEGFDGSSVNRNVFGRLLNFMADTVNRGKVVWLAAPNRPDLIDGAMLRSGRFDAIVAVLPPDGEESFIPMFHAMTRKNRVTLDANVSLAHAAGAVDGYTGADIERVVLKAASVARKNGHDAVTQDDLDHAITAVRVNTKDRDQMIRAALGVVNDLDLLPPLYRAMALAQDEQPPDAPVTVPQGRQARALALEE